MRFQFVTHSGSQSRVCLIVCFCLFVSFLICQLLRSYRQVVLVPWYGSGLNTRIRITWSRFAAKKPNHEFVEERSSLTQCNLFLFGLKLKNITLHRKFYKTKKSLQAFVTPFNFPVFTMTVSYCIKELFCAILHTFFHLSVSLPVYFFTWFSLSLSIYLKGV